MFNKFCYILQFYFLNDLFDILAWIQKIRKTGKESLIRFSKWTLTESMVADTRYGKNSFKKYIEEKGHIKFHLGDTVTEAKSRGKQITSVILKSGKELKCDMLILAVGVRPETDLAQNAGLEIDRGIIVNQYLRKGSDPLRIICRALPFSDISRSVRLQLLRIP